MSAAPALPMLCVSTWLNYAGATHSWEIAGGADNDAARDDWNRRLLDFVMTLK